MIAAAVLFEVILAGVVVLVVPTSLPDLGILYAAMSTPLSIAAAVVGVYVKKRSDDKAVAAGREAPSLMRTIASALGSK